MVQTDGGLNQSLIKEPELSPLLPPHVFPRFVSLKIALRVKKNYSVAEPVSHPIAPIKYLKRLLSAYILRLRQTAQHTGVSTFTQPKNRAFSGPAVFSCIRDIRRRYLGWERPFDKLQNHPQATTKRDVAESSSSGNIACGTHFKEDCMKSIAYCSRCRGMKVGWNSKYVRHYLVCKEVNPRFVKSLISGVVLSFLILAFPVTTGIVLSDLNPLPVMETDAVAEANSVTSIDPAPKSLGHLPC